MTTGVLLVNLGSPDSPNPSDVKRYLTEFLLDPDVIDYPWALRQFLVRRVIIPRRYRTSAASYAKIWTEKGSPLIATTEQLALQIESHLPHTKVAFAMRYQNPSIKYGLEQLKREKIDKLVVVPLFPQYAKATSGSVIKEVERQLKGWSCPPELTVIREFCTLPSLVDVFAQNGSRAKEYDHVLFSFHGLPERQIYKNDGAGQCQCSDECCLERSRTALCYRSHCIQTALAIADELDLPAECYSICFQSRLGREKWLTPYAQKTIEDLAKGGAKSLLVFSPSFVCDCLETLFEIGVEYREIFCSLGGEKLDLVPSLNNNPDWVEGLADLISQRARLNEPSKSSKTILQ